MLWAGKPLEGFKQGMDTIMITFGVQKSHSGSWLENGFRIILGIKRIDTIVPSTERIADMFQLLLSSSSPPLLVFNGLTEDMSMRRRQQEYPGKCIIGTKKESLMSSVKCC